MAATDQNPCSPEFTKEEVMAYTPSIKSESAQLFFGRHRFRIINGQDPALHPEKFTPLVSQRMQWPTWAEAYEWADAAKKSRKRGLFELEQPSEKKTPGVAAGVSSTPATNENDPVGRASLVGPALPFQLEA